MKTVLLCTLVLCRGLLAAASAATEPPTPYRTKLPAVNVAEYGTAAFANLYVETNAYGYVTHAEVKDTSHPALGQACLEAIRQWRYSPAREYGQPVPAKFIQPIRFSDGLISTAPEKPASHRPKATHREAPALPDALKHVTGHAVVAVQLDDQGQITAVTVDSSTHEELNPYCEAAVRLWKFSPALADGQRVASTVHVPFRFNGDPLEAEVMAKAAKLEDRDVIPLRQPSPRLPDALANATGEAEISFVVDPSGYVSQPEIQSSTDAALGELAREAVLGWKYRPAVRDGQPVAMRVLQPFRFNGGLVVTESRARVDKLPAATRTPQPKLPEALRRIPGYVTVHFDVDASGNVVSVEARDSSLAEFETPVLAAAKNWTFRPALKDGQPTASKVSVSFQFK